MTKQSDTTQNNLDTISLLVVDDDPLNRYLITEVLGNDNYRVFQASHGVEALTICQEKLPDLILLDVDMPVMDGFATCRAVRALPGGEMVPIIMLTGLDDAESIQLAYDCGATDFIGKPFNWLVLRQRLRYILRSSAAMQALQRSEQSLAQAQRLARIGQWEWDIETGIGRTSIEARKLFGLNPDLSELSLEKMFSFVSEQDANTFVHQLEEAIRTRNRMNYEYPLIVDGKPEVWLHTQAEIEFRGDKPVRLYGTSQDVTERRINEERYSTIFQNSAVAIFEVDLVLAWDEIQTLKKNGVEDFSRYFDAYPEELLRITRLFSFTDVNAAGISCFGFYSKHDLLAAIADNPWGNARLRRRLLTAMADGEAHVEVESDLVRATGESFCALAKINLPSTREGYRRLIVSILDITELKRQEEKLRESAQILESTSEAVMVISTSRTIRSVNPAFTAMTGFTCAEIIGHAPLMLLADSEGDLLQASLWDELSDVGQWQGEMSAAHKNGSSFPIWLTLSAIHDADGEVSGYVLLFSDISQIKATEQQLVYLAHHDSLTGLPNRHFLQQTLERDIANAARSNRRFAILFIDLDGFKLINDTLGHAQGDEILFEVAQRLRSICREGDLLARLGGDEFTLVISDLENNVSATRVTEHVLGVLEAPFVLQGRELFVGASVGISIFPDDGISVGDLLKNADSAMYKAKDRGRGQFNFYSPELTEENQRRLALENELRRAINEGELYLVYQPKFLAGDGGIIGVEALVRWRHPQRGLVMPAEFIAVSEQTGLVVPLGEWVINEACRQIRDWQERFGTMVQVAVNVSAVQLRRVDFVAKLAASLQLHDVLPRLLEIEMTEDFLDFRDLSFDPNVVLNQLSKLGLSIALDDFGTGYSSLSNLKRLPISTLKVDRAFVRDICADGNDAAIVSAIIAISRTLKLLVVAEGVEAEDQAEFLRQLGCNILQGFLYSKPLEAADFERVFLAQLPKILQ